MTSNIFPVVGYQGGKRRLLKRLRPFFPVPGVEHYVEPFVGMGANYLDLRARGFIGLAMLADTNPEVRAFWRLAHQDGPALVDVVKRMDDLPKSRDGYYEVADAPVLDEIERVGRFLWICNYAYGNVPPFYLPEQGKWGNRVGEKFTSAAVWNKTFPWSAVIDRTFIVTNLLAGCPVEVVDSAQAAIAQTHRDSHVYADPPYASTARQYGRQPEDYVAMVLPARGTVVLSEASDLATRLTGWEEDVDSVVARTSHREGASGQRREALYVRRA